MNTTWVILMSILTCAFLPRRSPSGSAAPSASITDSYASGGRALCAG
jgi:hypothetical protein